MKRMIDLLGVAISFQVDSKLIRADFFKANPILMKKALITGQAGSHLADLLLNKGYEVHHLSAQSHVRVSFDLPEYTGIGSPLRLEAMRKASENARSYQASSSKMFDKVPIRFPELFKIMVDAELASLQGLTVPDPLTLAYR